jgi:hypothetical protein
MGSRWATTSPVDPSANATVLPVGSASAAVSRFLFYFSGRRERGREGGRERERERGRGEPRRERMEDATMREEGWGWGR